jgi:DNA repair exonuclease SbcCD nuclease subunit
MTYAVLSDIHAHAFSLFSKTETDGVNSRLRITLNEMKRAAQALQAAGGTRMVIAGDLLHTRGQIDPEVLNPLRSTIEEILAMGIDIDAIPGNHDLKSAETQELSSSIQNLAQISPSGGVFTIHNEPIVIGIDASGLAFVPWRNAKEQLLKDLEALANGRYAALKGSVDVFIHAGIDGVLSGMPAHGLTHVELGAFGFRRVFAGHFHNHKDFGNGVVSIGATSHHNWGDVGTRAGFLLVNETDGSFTFHRSQAPHFIDISGMQPDDIAMVAPGNYCRVRGSAMTADEIKDLRQLLSDMGAMGTSIEVPRVGQALRTTKPTTGMTIPQSIESFVKASPPASVDPALVIKRAIETLNESQSVAV